MSKSFFFRTFAGVFEKGMAYVATIGFFDGVHVGHQFLLSSLRQQAAQRAMKAAVVTFEEHPRSVLYGISPALLTTYEERTALLKQQALDEIYVFQFDVIRDMTSAEFLHLLHDRCEVHVLLMGYDHQFGSDGKKAMTEYQRLGEEAGVEVLPITQAPEGDVSSSKIRRLLLAGDVSNANAMLGRPYALQGTVVHGRGLGRKIGFPTANIRVENRNKLIPSDGVYAVQVTTADNCTRKAVLNIGTNPTVGGEERTLEVHIPGFSGDLYNQSIDIKFTRYIREERKFITLDILRNQIQQDLISLNE